MNDTNIYPPQFKGAFEAKQYYESKGLLPLAILPDRSGDPKKGPDTPAWAEQSLLGFSDADYQTHNANVGIVLGDPKSTGKSVVDKDDDWKVQRVNDAGNEYMAYYLPPTWAWGREGKPNSHHLFFTDAVLFPDQKDFRTPVVGNIPAETIFEIRQGKGPGHALQTVAPGSTWFDKSKGATQPEAIRFEPHSAPEIGFVPADVARRVIREAHAVCLLAIYFPDSDRHFVLCALSRVLRDAGIPLDKAKNIILSGYACSRNPNPNNVLNAKHIADVYNAKETTHLYGYPYLVSRLGKEVTAAIVDALGIKRVVLNAARRPFTEVGIATRFVDENLADFRYVTDLQQWRFWDEKAWGADDRRNLIRRIGEMGKLFRQELKEIEMDCIRYAALQEKSEQNPLTDDERQELGQLEISISIMGALQKAIKWVESARAVDAISKLASADRRIQAHSTDFDANPELINCVNGVMNLRTKELLPHDRKLMLTSICPTEYDSNAASPEFETGIVDYSRCGSTEQPDLLEYKQRFFGYCITGYTTEKIIPIVHGTADTGKSTELRCIKETLGSDYASGASIDSFMSVAGRRQAGNATPDLARIWRKRFVLPTEMKKNERFNEEFLKSLTGGEERPTRNLYESEISGRSTMKPIFQTNWLPSFDGADPGIARRIRLIPYEHSFGMTDTMAGERYVNNPQVRKACLRWLVDGAFKYLVSGLTPCAKVESVTQTSISDNDPLGKFLGEAVETTKEDKDFVSRSGLYARYKGWCESNGEKPWSSSGLYSAMRDRGFHEHKRGVLGFKFLKLVADETVTDSAVQAAYLKLQEQKKVNI